MGGKGIFIFLVKERIEKHFTTAQFDEILSLHNSSFYKTKIYFSEFIDNFPMGTHIVHL